MWSDQNVGGLQHVAYRYVRMLEQECGVREIVWS
jgi:hypothetical protein